VRNVAGFSIRETGHKGYLGSSTYSMLPAAQQIPIQRLNPENKGALPYIPLQAVYGSKKLNPYMVICISIGYFTLSVMRPSSCSDF
jgi:hypothetical protein